MAWPPTGFASTVSTPMTTTFAALPQLCMTKMKYSSAPISVSSTPRVVTFVELCMREKVSGMRTTPTAPAKAKKQPPTMKMSIITLSTMFIACPPDTCR